MTTRASEASTTEQGSLLYDPVTVSSGTYLKNIVSFNWILQRNEDQVGSGLSLLDCTEEGELCTSNFKVVS